LHLNLEKFQLEEGDVLIEINGISTKHLTLNEVLKQLRCCGNHILLKLKSDPLYKSHFRELKHQKHTLSELQSHVTSTQSSPLPCSALSASPQLSTTPTRKHYTSLSPLLLNSKSQLLSPSAASHVTSLRHSSVGTAPVFLRDTRNASKSFDDCMNAEMLGDDLSDRSPNSIIALNLNADGPKLSDPNLTPKLSLKHMCKNESESTSTVTNSSSSSTSSASASPESIKLIAVRVDQSQQLVNDVEHMHLYDNNIPAASDDALLIESGDVENSMVSGHHQIGAGPPVGPNASIVNNLLFQFEIDETIKKKIDEKLRDCSSESDSEMIVYTPKAVDLPSAQRLAKRLFYLDGFKANDIVRHLAKKNDFSQLVADEYLKLFNFQGLTLDSALRKFLKQFQLVGDAQEKEKVLMYFAKRYVDSNETAFTDVDTCHTLTCAIMLLNTDLHDPKILNKMALFEFIENLKGLNNGSNFTDALLESLYSAIKNEPLECAPLEVEDIPFEERVVAMNTFGNPFLPLPDPQAAKEHKSGWLLRKCCIEADGKRAPFLKRSWKMYYVTLRDMVLYLHKDDKEIKKNIFDNISNAIRVHHAYASVATDYKKKQFVFRLKTADWAEYLFQASNTNDLNEWINVINLIAASHSSPALAGAVSSSRTFQRPLLPVSTSPYTIHEQYEYYRKHVKQLQLDLSKLESIKDEKFFDKDKYNYYIFENKRYSTYLKLLEERLSAEIGTVSNANVSPSTNHRNAVSAIARTPELAHTSKSNHNAEIRNFVNSSNRLVTSTFVD